MKRLSAATDGTSAEQAINHLLSRAVTGVPLWRRSRTRRELRGYAEDALTDLLHDGATPEAAVAALEAQFGDPDTVAAGFRALPPPRLARGMQRSMAPLGVAVVGLVLGLALVQVQTPATRFQASTPSDALVTLSATPDSQQLALLPVREVDHLAAAPAINTAAREYQVASRLGVSRFSPQVLQPNVPALSPAWLPAGYSTDQGALFLTTSATVLYFAHASGDQPGMVIEVLRPDLSTVFQVKERHVFPVQRGALAGFYIDGEWEVRGPQGEQPAPPAWRTDRSHTFLFARDGLLVLVAGPATIGAEELIRVGRSLR